MPHAQSGKLRILAMAGKRRAPVLPDVPTIAEAALPGFELDNWNGFLAPAGTPRPIIARKVSVTSGSTVTRYSFSWPRSTRDRRRWSPSGSDSRSG